jgi:PAS domain S-box-containing protein
LDSAGRITRWNLAASQTFGINAESAKGHTLGHCGIKWVHPDIDKEICAWLRIESVFQCSDLAYESGRGVRFVGVSVRPIFSKQDDKTGFIVTGADVTERKCLEDQLRQAHKLEAVGQLAAGIAHEINTPTQYIGDNTTFLKESWEPILKLLNFCRTMQQEASEKGSVPVESFAEFDRLSEQCDLGYLAAEIPHAIDQSLEGLQRVAKIVRAMKEFSHPGSEEKQPVDINLAIEATATVARSEWKHVADVVMELAPDLPLVPGLAGELKQVILNLIINAAHAIADVVGDGSSGKGKITITTRREEDCVEVTVGDTGTGIPIEIRSRVFEPFFTSKPVGKGTGQGLALAHTIVVKGHEGRIWFETEVGRGTKFLIRLPLAAKAQRASQ